MDDSDFLKRLIETFKLEADESLKNISSFLVELEKDPKSTESYKIQEAIYREFHSLKGAARAVNFSEIESICKALESVMSCLKSNTIKLTQYTLDILHKSINLLNHIITSNKEELDQAFHEQIKFITNELLSIEKGEVKQSSGKTAPTKRQTEKITNPIKKKANNTIRISTNKLDNLLTETEELLPLKSFYHKQNIDLKNTIESLDFWLKESNVFEPVLHKTKINNENLELTLNETKRINDLVNFCEWSHSYLKSTLETLKLNRKNLVQETVDLNRKIDSLLTDVKDLISVPFSNLINSFPKIVRDIAKDVGKEVEFVTAGVDIEIDRRILELIHHPLIHLLRNCIDYGIENTETRLEHNKPRCGKIEIQIEQLENNKIQILITDDGKGVDIETLRNLYVKNENIASAEAKSLDDSVLLNYIFKSGVTTSEIVTDLSGRGLGLAIVQEKIDQMGGNITVSSEKNIGTSFKIEIPLTLITFRGIIIKLANHKFIIPLSNILKVQRVKKDSIKTFENKKVIFIQERAIPILNLKSILDINEQKSESEYMHTAILENNNNLIAFSFDEIIDEQEILVKKFNKQLTRVKYVSGASVINSGDLVPILNTYDLLNSSDKGNNASTSFDNNKDSQEQKKSVLVVEDSITSRTLLKNILETTGYNVTTAIDGIDGYTKLKEGNYNALVSDIEMPRMDGFELTAKVRADKDLSNLPILLVTSLSKKEDKERGIDVGANAYIIKSSFEQSNLIEILERLI